MQRHFFEHRKHHNDKSFFDTLLFTFMLSSIISTLILTIFLTVNYINSITTTLKKANQQLLSQTNFAINQMDENAQRLVSSFLTNSHIMAYLYSLDIESTIPVLTGNDIKKQLLALPYVESIYLYNSATGYVYSSKTGYQTSLEDFENKEAAALLKDIDFLKSSKNRPVPGSRDPKTNAAATVSYYFPISFSENLPDTIVINITLSSLTDSIDSLKRWTTDSDSGFILLDESRSYLTGILNGAMAADDDWLTYALKSVSSSNNPDSSFVKINGSYYFQVCTKDNCYGWYLLNYISAKDILQDVILTTLTGFLLFLGVLAISFFFCMYFSRRLHTPVQTLVRALNEEKQLPAANLNAPKEFQKILSAVSALQSHNQQLRSLQQKTKYSRTQDCLNRLLENHNLDSPELTRQQLEHLGLSYLEQEKLCMAVLKIDNYQRFLSLQNPDDLWAVRFSTINVVEELASTAFSCNAFSRSDDKFVLLMAVRTPDNDSGIFDENDIPDLLLTIQENISRFLHFTVSIAYSTIFHGLDNLPVVYANLKNSLLLKMQCGHNCIIDPYLFEDIPDEDFQLSSRGVMQLTDHLANGQAQAAWSDYQSLTSQLFSCHYHEIMSAIIRMVYMIYERLIEKYPMIKDDITQNMKRLLANLEYAEIADDIHRHIRTFFEDTSTAIQKLKEDPAQQNAAIISEKMTAIIQKEYANPALCLCSIADKIGLSTNYAGHIFKQCIGMSVSQYILELRMEQVAHLLEATALPLQQILEKVGLEKNNYFYTRFKNHFGMSLSEYKQKLLDASSEQG